MYTNVYIHYGLQLWKRGLWAMALIWQFGGFTALATEPLAPETPSSEQKQFNSNKKTRNFYQVLDDVLGDFEYDLKNGQVMGLKDVTIRNIATSENIPPSFKSHLELLISEKILKNTKTHLIQCLACRSKKASLANDNVVISSTDANPAELARLAKLNGIQNFLDIAFSYQPTGMMLSLDIVDSETGSAVWSRTYNSETSRAAAFRRGVDYNQIEAARNQSEYKPTPQYRFITYYLFEPNVGTESGVLAFGFRAVERYDNRKKEVGFELDYMKDSSTIANSKIVGAKNLYSGANATLLFVHSWNLIGYEENFNLVRGNIFLAVGGTYSPGFLGGLLRGGYEWRLGKHWAISANLGFRPSGTAYKGTSTVGSVSGIEAGAGINALF